MFFFPSPQVLRNGFCHFGLRRNGGDIHLILVTRDHRSQENGSRFLLDVEMQIRSVHLFLVRRYPVAMIWGSNSESNSNLHAINSPNQLIMILRHHKKTLNNFDVWLYMWTMVKNLRANCPNIGGWSSIINPLGFLYELEIIIMFGFPLWNGWPYHIPHSSYVLT